MAVENFHVRGQDWKRITHEADERWIVGVDLGCSVDPTAICVMRYSKKPLETFTTRKAKNFNGPHINEQNVETRLDVLHLERLPLHTDYPAQVEYIASLLARDPLRREDPDLVTDETGVGRPVGDLLVRAGLRPLRLCITAGNEQVRAGNRRYNVAKSILISGLDAALHTGELRFAAALRDAGTMADELANFNRHVGAAGRATYAARTGAHDDLVLAVALCVWRAKGNGPQALWWGGVAGVIC